MSMALHAGRVEWERLYGAQDELIEWVNRRLKWRVE